jgi:hypothetical protein
LWFLIIKGFKLIFLDSFGGILADNFTKEVLCDILSAKMAKKSLLGKRFIERPVIPQSIYFVADNCKPEWGLGTTSVELCETEEGI